MNVALPCVRSQGAGGKEADWGFQGRMLPVQVGKPCIAERNRSRAYAIEPIVGTSLP